MMLPKRTWTRLLAALPLLMLIACVDQGKVDQGRVVTFDKDKRTVTIIRDKKIDTLNPDYSYLPPLTYSLPAIPAEMGPEPKAGGRMKLDIKTKQITIFDPQQQNFRVIDVQITDLMENIEKTNPLVYDEVEKKAKKFPVIDKAKRTVTIYSGRQKMLCTAQVPEEFMALPDAIWDAGDECRIYYKEEGKALRFMNISKTDIFKK